MRTPLACLSLVVFMLAGCGSKLDTRNEPVEAKGKVTIAGNLSPKDLTITFQPQQNTPMAGAKLNADGTFTVKIHPGKYVVYFTEEANATVSTYKQLPASFKKITPENSISVGSGDINVEVK